MKQRKSKRMKFQESDDETWTYAKNSGGPPKFNKKNHLVSKISLDRFRRDELYSADSCELTANNEIIMENNEL